MGQEMLVVLGAFFAAVMCLALSGGLLYSCVLGLRKLWSMYLCHVNCTKIVLYVDEDDKWDILVAIATMEREGELPDGEGNLDGRSLGEISRAYLEMMSEPIEMDE